MKHFSFTLLTLAFALLALCSCNKAKNISVDSDKVIFNVAGGQKNIIVTADGNYDVQDCPEWVKAEKGENILTLSTKANATGATRNCVIHLVGAEGVSVAIAVVQPDKCTHITASPAEVTIPKEGGSAEVAIDTDGANLKVEVGDDIQANYADGKLTLTAPANEGGTKQGTVNLTCDEQRASINYTIEGSICPTCNGTGKVKCTKCGGKGWIPDGGGGDCGWHGCRSCGGNGYTSRYTEYDDYLGYPVSHIEKQPGYRDGSGKMNCPTCGGAGH